MVAIIAALHVAGFALLAGADGITAGAGLAAYALGLRHALDADHIGAIDNSTRRLMAAGQRPRSVGFFFALGHSTVVFAASALLAAGVAVLGFGAAGGVIGPLVSGAFLIVIGLANLRAGCAGGPLRRLYGVVRAPWHMYPLGLLFGLGLDTAASVAALTAAAGAALCLPILFAAGMTLVDTLDGALMLRAYGRDDLVRRLTALSVAVALVVGTAQLLSVAGPDVLPPQTGLVVVALFALAWAAPSARRAVSPG